MAPRRARSQPRALALGARRAAPGRPGRARPAPWRPRLGAGASWRPRGCHRRWRPPPRSEPGRRLASSRCSAASGPQPRSRREGPGSARRRPRAGSRRSRRRLRRGSQSSRAVQSASPMSRSPIMKPPPCIHSSAGRSDPAEPAASPYTRTGTGPCGPSMVRSRVGTAAGGRPGARGTRASGGPSPGRPSPRRARRCPRGAGSRDATASWIGMAQPAAGTGNIDSLEPVIQPTTWSRSQPSTGTSATLRPRLRMTIRSATS